MAGNLGNLSWGYRKGEKKRREQGVISVCLTSQIAKPVQMEIPFDEYKADSTPAGLVSNGKSVVLTNMQTRIVMALSYSLTMDRDSEELKGYIENIKQGKQAQPITRDIDVSSLTRFVLRIEKPAPNKKRMIIDELKRISEIEQRMIIGKYEVTQPLFKTFGSIRDTTNENGKHVIRLAFSPVFFYEVSNRFAVLPQKVFQLWGVKGNGTETELYSCLLNQLYSVYGGHHAEYMAAANKARRENKGKSENEIASAIKSAQYKALQYSEYGQTIQSRLANNKYKDRRRKKEFYTDMEKAISNFKEIGLITSCKMVITSKGERWDFQFSPDYNKQDEIG